MTLPGEDGKPLLELVAPGLVYVDKKVVLALMILTAEKRRPPTTREIAAFWGWKSNNHVLPALPRLKKKGWIRWERGHARTLKLLKKPRFVPIVSPGTP